MMVLTDHGACVLMWLIPFLHPISATISASLPFSSLHFSIPQLALLAPQIIPFHPHFFCSSAILNWQTQGLNQTFSIGWLFPLSLWCIHVFTFFFTFLLFSFFKELSLSSKKETSNVFLSDIQCSYYCDPIETVTHFAFQCQFWFLILSWIWIMRKIIFPCCLMVQGVSWSSVYTKQK